MQSPKKAPVPPPMQPPVPSPSPSPKQQPVQQPVQSPVQQPMQAPVQPPMPPPMQAPMLSSSQLVLLELEANGAAELPALFSGNRYLGTVLAQLVGSGANATQCLT